MKKIFLNITLLSLLVLQLFVFIPGSLFAISPQDSLLLELPKASGISRVNLLNEISHFLSLNDPLKSLEYAKKALKESGSLEYKKGEAEAYNNFGRAYQKLKSYNLSLDYYKKSVKIFNELGDIENIIKPLNNLGTVFHITGQVDKALEFYEKSLEFRRQIEDKDGIVNTLYNISLLYRNQGNIEKALDYLKEMSELSKSIGDKKMYSRSLRSLATIFKSLGDYEEVVKYSQLNLEMIKESGDDENYLKSLLILGNIYTNINKYDQALEYHYEALKLSMDSKDSSLIASALTNIGIVFYQKKSYESALEYYQQALNISQKKNYSSGISKLYNNIGLVYMDQENYEKALEYCEKSLKIKVKSKIGSDAFSQYSSIAQIYTKLGNLPKARDYANEALKIALEDNAKRDVSYIYLILYEINKDLGNYKQALDYHSLYSDIKDTIMNEDFWNRITAMQVRNKTREKEKENQLLKAEKENQKLLFILIFSFVSILIIVLYILYMNKKKANSLLTQKNIQIERVNVDLSVKNLQVTAQKEELSQMFGELQLSEAKLREANATKDKFFSILAHDLKNPLQAMILSSYMLANNYEKMDRDKLEDSFDKLHKSSNHLANLLENLLQWARTQSGGIEFNPEPLGLRMIVENNISFLNENAVRKDIKIKNNIVDEITCFCDLNMISTVLRNLITNAIKFTQIGGEINIHADVNGEYLSVTVEDNGIGIADENIDKLFRIDVHHTSIGTSKEKGTGLGLILSKEFVEINGGEIFVESKYGRGSRFNFTLPKSSANLNYESILAKRPNIQL